ncbi:pimeloyl-ACP methyl ester carboxylesterase [Natronospira proteinivora]|uniref:Pimeloyl-ACP methyl ester carboxylesterase n=1 Tax=Natronospira proteinivora TaxID=1807133 RepID=A0ABT1G922_9GAMM|nr:alpha/beta hydrolase [Natronospira proteinivora]MCP1727819.1 pimeloyl-ACP methyl ester carboxylesterase [Natronospira proteinivora]
MRADRKRACGWLSRGLFLLLLLMVVPVHALPGLEKTRLPDPVLGEHVTVYHGGKEGGHPVVLVHGIGGDSVTAWNALVPPLRDDYFLLAMDLPGFGDSAGGNRLYSQDAYAEVLQHVIEEFTDEPVILIGHSLGGAVALRYAARYPEQVHRLHLVSVAGILHQASYTEFLAGGGPYDGERADTVHPVLGKAIRKFVRRAPGGERVLGSQLLRRLILRGDPERIAALALVSTDFSETLDQVSAPTAVYWGVDDATAPLRTGQLLAARLPQGSLTVFDDAGHMPMRETPQRFNRSLIEALDRPIRHGEAVRPPVGAGRRDAVCQGESGWRLSGAYRHVVIEDCDSVVLDRVSARSLEIRDSRVKIHASAIVRESEDEPAVLARNSRVSVTAGRLQGEPVIDTGRSSLDLAGVRLQAQDILVSNPEPSASEIVFSVSAFQKPGEAGYLHRVIGLEKGETM